jgi:hypothetical protein
MSVTPVNIAVALGRTAPDAGSADDLQWQMWIDDALMLIGARLGDTTLLDQAKLDYVVREAVVAQVRRPDSATQVTVAVDDASTMRTYRSSKGRIEILDEWWELLSPTESKGKAFEVDTMPADAGVYGVDYWWSAPDQTSPF